MIAKLRGYGVPIRKTARTPAASTNGYVTIKTSPNIYISASCRRHVPRTLPSPQSPPPWTKRPDIKRESLRLELEAIQSRYEDGSLPRASYKRLRENVALMQMDLEDNL